MSDADCGEWIARRDRDAGSREAAARRERHVVDATRNGEMGTEKEVN